ncbi:MAG: hypothetical protein WDA13_04045 [Candidatus Shapirobacteria bacterium]
METGETINPIEREIEKLNRNFDNLPIGGEIDLKMSMVHPIDIDDLSEPRTSGPIEVARDQKTKEIKIDDGDHRFYKVKRRLLAENDYHEPDWRTIDITVKKVYPTNTWIINQK